MIIGSGFTLTDEAGNSIRVPFSTRNCFMEILRSEGVTSGGLLRQQIAGSRVVITEGNVRLTETEYGALMTFLTRSTTLYRYYQSDERPSYIPVTEWPLSVVVQVVSKARQAYGGKTDGIVYVCEIEMRSVGLIV